MKNAIDLSQPPIPALGRFYEGLSAGDASALGALFIADPSVDTPLLGKVEGSAAFARFVAEQQNWLQAHRGRAELFYTILTEARAVLEFILFLDLEGETIDLPVALAADLQEGGVRAIRIYHSTWPLSGEHLIRPPVLAPPVEALEEPAVIRAYMAGIGKPDKALVLSLFAENGYVREPSGARYKHSGPEGLHNFYGPALDSGGVILHHCSATFDGKAFAVEYICDEWAHVKLPPQAGLAVYELAGPDKIQAARIYDDVMPPFE